MLIDGCAGLTGALLPEAWLASRRQALVGFATGVILGVAFLDILPEALIKGDAKTILGHPPGQLQRHRGLGVVARTSPQPPRLAHHLADHAARLRRAPQCRRRCCHRGGVPRLAPPRRDDRARGDRDEVPQEVGDYAISRSAGVSRGRAVVALSLVQLTAGLGALAAILAASAWTSATRGVLGIAAGTFVYIGGSDLLPELLHESHDGRAGWQAIAGFLAGLVVAVASSALG